MMYTFFIMKFIQYILFIIMAWQDARTRSIFLSHLILFCLSSICFIKLQNIMFAFLIFIVLWALAYYKKNIALADIVLIFICCLMLEFEDIGRFLILIGAAGLIMGIYKNFKDFKNISKNKLYKIKNFKLPLVPFIFFAYLTTSILLYIGS